MLVVIKQEKTCCKCKLEQPISNFYKNKTGADGYNSWCKFCQKGYFGEYYEENKYYFFERVREARKTVSGQKQHATWDENARKRKEDDSEVYRYLKELKKKSCLDCDKSYPSHVMDFDHIQGPKLFNIGDAVRENRTLEEVLIEVEKCELVCAKCHRMRTATRGSMAIVDERKKNKALSIEPVEEVFDKSLPGKNCTICFNWKPLTEFSKKTKTLLCSKCKSCQRTYAKQHYQLNKDSYQERIYKTRAVRILEVNEIIQPLKKEPCLDCKENSPHYTLEFDHVKGDKLFDINTFKHFSPELHPIEELIDEIAKCELVCTNCHRIRTFERFNTKKKLLML